MNEVNFQPTASGLPAKTHSRRTYFSEAHADDDELGSLDADIHLDTQSRPVSDGRAVRLTYHAWQRTGSRRISDVALAAVLTYGRVAYTRGAKVFALGRREVHRFARHGIDLADHEGIQVVCTPDGSTVLTTYRDRDFRRLRPHRRRQRRRW